MDDLNEKLAGILNDPQSMEQVRKMAENLFGSEAQPAQASESNDFAGFPSGDELQTIMTLMSHFKGQNEDDRTRLINALKPYLSEKRQEKAENAIKVLKLLEILPLLKDSGLFKF